MANLSAAELQRKHNSLEGMNLKKFIATTLPTRLMPWRFAGAPDPFPSLLGNELRKPKAAPQANGKGTLDKSESSFPSLAPSAPSNKAPSSSKPIPSSWGVGSGALRKPTKISQPVYSSNFTLDKVELARGQDGKPVTLGNVMKEVMNKTKTKIEASTQRTTGGTTFHIRGDSESAVEAAIRAITAILSSQVGCHSCTSVTALKEDFRSPSSSTLLFLPSVRLLVPKVRQACCAITPFSDHKHPPRRRYAQQDARRNG